MLVVVPVCSAIGAAGSFLDVRERDREVRQGGNTTLSSVPRFAAFFWSLNFCRICMNLTLGFRGGFLSLVGSVVLFAAQSHGGYALQAAIQEKKPLRGVARITAFIVRNAIFLQNLIVSLGCVGAFLTGQYLVLAATGGFLLYKTLLKRVHISIEKLKQVASIEQEALSWMALLAVPGKISQILGFAFRVIAKIPYDSLVYRSLSRRLGIPFRQDWCQKGPSVLEIKQITDEMLRRVLAGEQPTFCPGYFYQEPPIPVKKILTWKDAKEKVLEWRKNALQESRLQGDLNHWLSVLMDDERFKDRLAQVSADSLQMWAKNARKSPGYIAAQYLKRPCDALLRVIEGDVRDFVGEPGQAQRIQELVLECLSLASGGDPKRVEDVLFRIAIRAQYCAVGQIAQLEAIRDKLRVEFSGYSLLQAGAVFQSNVQEVLDREMQRVLKDVLEGPETTVLAQKFYRAVGLDKSIEDVHVNREHVMAKLFWWLYTLEGRKEMLEFSGLLNCILASIEHRVCPELGRFLYQDLERGVLDHPQVRDKWKHAVRELLPEGRKNQDLSHNQYLALYRLAMGSHAFRN